MIKIASAAYHMNIGDSRSSKLLKGYIDTITTIETRLCGYDGTQFKTREEIDRYCFETNAIIIGSGGCFNSSPKGRILLADDPELYKHINCPLIVMASGFNRDYETFDFTQQWKETIHALFERADLIGLRTIDDQQLAIAYGADKSKTFCCPDPLLFIGGQTQVFNESKVGVSLYTDRWWGIIEKTLIEYNYIPVLISHESSDFRFNDYSDCNFIISKRFHGQLISFAYHKPCFSIESNIKHRFARRLLYPPDLYSYIDNHLVSEEFTNRFQEFVSNKERMRYNIRPRSIELKNMFSDFLLKVEKVINV
jgi:hypothetical protein